MNFNQNVEYNNAVRDHSSGKINQGSPIVKVFSHMSSGRDMSELNSLKNNQGQTVNVDECVNYIKNLAYQASAGNQHAAVELNELRMFSILPLLQEELKLLSWMGNYTSVGYGDSIYRTLDKLGGDKSRFQALNGDVVFPAWEHDKYPVNTVTVSGGYQIDYRKLAFGDMSLENVGMEQVRVDIRNKASQYVIYTIWNSINNTNNVSFVSQGAGVTKQAVDEMVRDIRRFGQVNIFGDYSMVSQINGMLGYEGVTPIAGYVPGAVSQTAMDEIRRDGLIGMYNGALVKEIKNEFNLTRPIYDASGKGVSFETYFPNNIMFFIPAGMQSPVATWTRGGLTSYQSGDAATGKILTRFDLEVACDVAKSHEYKIGMITDTALAADPSNPVLNPRG